jgi:glycine betaine/proline transport system permease protein
MNYELPIGAWIEALVDYIVDNFQPGLDAIAAVIDGFGGGVDRVLMATPAWLMIAILVALALWRIGIGFALFTLGSLLLIASMALWQAMLSTLGLVISSTVFSLLIGVPLGILMTRNETVESVTKTVLDFMQTMPAFVYLIPAVMFFGLGRVPGIIATVIFAMPPAVRLTALGIKQVPIEMVEAGRAFGCTDRQLLWRVQLPNAMPAIMAGVNQAMMLALSMIVIASMIGAGGLGNVVLQGIQRLDVGLGFKSGLSVVLLAIILDRLTQSFGAEGAPGRAARLARLTRYVPRLGARAGRSDSLQPKAGAQS